MCRHRRPVKHDGWRDTANSLPGCRWQQRFHFLPSIILSYYSLKPVWISHQTTNLHRKGHAVCLARPVNGWCELQLAGTFRGKKLQLLDVLCNLRQFIFAVGVNRLQMICVGFKANRRFETCSYYFQKFVQR